ncbi:uncharacterized protein BKA78DRAFT_308719, partial [Phyllosticta capitalensis]|uniref:uncharacterized protein n=1 Tax=Phyllosticta capitalensis TaxID=121624 RepID=UPI0031321E11
SPRSHPSSHHMTTARTRAKREKEKKKKNKRWSRRTTLASQRRWSMRSLNTLLSVRLPLPTSASDVSVRVYVCGTRHEGCYINCRARAGRSLIGLTGRPLIRGEMHTRRLGRRSRAWCLAARTTYEKENFSTRGKRMKKRTREREASTWTVRQS